jgi:hypothetical protein
MESPIFKAVIVGAGPAVLNKGQQSRTDNDIQIL